MNLPLPLFFRMFENLRDSYAIIDGRAYIINNCPGGIGRARLIGENFFLHESERIGYLENTYLHENKKYLDSLIINEKKRIDYSLQSQKRTRGDLERRVSNHRFISFFVNELYPHFVRDETEKYEDKKVANKKYTTPKIDLSNLFVKEVLSGKDVILTARSVNKLEKGKNKGNNHIILNDFKYVITNSFSSIQDLKRVYVQKLKEKLITALGDENERLLSQLKDYENRNRLFSDIIDKTEYVKNGVGFVKIDDSSYYIFKSIPKSYEINLTTDDNIIKTYRFPPCRVAVEVTLDSKEIKADIWPIVLEEYSHPFLRVKNKEKQPICVGNDSAKARYKESQKEEKTALKIKTALDKGESTLKYGYTRETRPHKLLKEFPEFEIENRR